MKQHMVQLHNVVKSFSDNVVVNNVTMHINKGEFLTLLGPSGCGENDHIAHDCRLRTAD